MANQENLLSPSERTLSGIYRATGITQHIDTAILTISVAALVSNGAGITTEAVVAGLGAATINEALKRTDLAPQLRFTVEATKAIVILGGVPALTGSAIRDAEEALLTAASSLVVSEGSRVLHKLTGRIAENKIATESNR